MTTTKTISREQRIYLAIWRKAWLERDSGSDLTINCSSKSMALTQRLGLYRAIRPYRIGEAFDEELRQAAETYVACLVQDKDKWAIKLRPRMILSELEAELAALGLDEEDLLLQEEKLMSEELKDFVESPSLPRPANPFYKRD